MKLHRFVLLTLISVTAFGTAGYMVWNAASGDTSRAASRKVLFYQDSMHPWVRSDHPGKCTVCGMDLTAIYEGSKAFETDGNVILLSSNNVTVLNLQSEQVQRRPLTQTLRVAGTLEQNESRRVVVSAPAQGRVQSVGVDYAGVEVSEGQSLITLLSAELIQKRAYIRAANVQDARYVRDSGHNEMKSDPFSSVLVAPLGGTVVERAVAPGQYVLEGEKLLTIVDPSVLWFRFDVYENQLPWLAPGQKVNVTVPGAPGKVFPAAISFIEPTVNEASRTVKVRADISNPIVGTNLYPQRLLRFGMYAEARIPAVVGDVLTVPRSAILFPGDTAYVYVDAGHGAYERRRVKLGRHGDDYWEVLHGLEEGERVVTSGNALIDAQAQFSRQSDDRDAEANESASEESHSSHMVHTTPACHPNLESLDPAQAKEIGQFLDLANKISQDLAADNLDALRLHASKLPQSIASVAGSFSSDHSWFPVLQRIEAASHWPVPADLAEARKEFLPFSTNVVELVQQVRMHVGSFQSLKVYHCPMAPKPGLWFQTTGPLRNPYYGAEMLMCGEEVRPPTSNALPMSGTQPTPVIKPDMAMDSMPGSARPEPMLGADADDSSESPASEQKAPAPVARRLNRLEQAYARSAEVEDMKAKRWATIAAAQAIQPDSTNHEAAKPPGPIITGVTYEQLVRRSGPAVSTVPSHHPAALVNAAAAGSNAPPSTPSQSQQLPASGH